VARQSGWIRPVAGPAQGAGRDDAIRLEPSLAVSIYYLIDNSLLQSGAITILVWRGCPNPSERFQWRHEARKGNKFWKDALPMPAEGSAGRIESGVGRCCLAGGEL
jgi:hypothetical protein